MIFIRMRLVEFKWGLAILLGCAFFGMSGVLGLSIPYLFLVGALVGLFDVVVTAAIEDVFLLFFTVGVVIGLPHMAEHFAEDFKREIEPLRQRRLERRHSNKLRKSYVGRER